MGKEELHAVFMLWTTHRFVKCHNADYPVLLSIAFLVVPSVWFAFLIASEH